MESAAPPGVVMLSVSTARLVEGAGTVGESELAQIKGADAPVPARQLLGMVEGHRVAGRADSNLVGRRWEMSAVQGLFDRAIEGAVLWSPTTTSNVLRLGASPADVLTLIGTSWPTYSRTGKYRRNRALYGELALEIQRLTRGSEVELMKRYSKPVYQGRRLRRMVELAEKSAEMPAREATSLPQAQRVDRRLSPETIAELVQAYWDGASSTELRRHYELSQGSVIKLLHEHSVAMRNQGLVGDDVATATELYQSGATLAQLGERFSARRMALGDGDQATELAVFGVSVAFELDCQLRQSLRIEVSPLTVVPHGFQRSA